MFEGKKQFDEFESVVKGIKSHEEAEEFYNKLVKRIKELPTQIQDIARSNLPAFKKMLKELKSCDASKEKEYEEKIEHFRKSLLELSKAIADKLKIKEKAPYEAMEVRSGAESEARKPGENEDSFVSEPQAGVFAVFDGMGGHAGGELASRLAKEGLEKRIAKLTNELSPEQVKDELVDILKEINNDIYEHESQQGLPDNAIARMGATASVVKIWEGKDGRRKAIIGNIGDSRVYIYHKDSGKFEQITVDEGVSLTLDIDVETCNKTIRQKTLEKEKLEQKSGDTKEIKVLQEEIDKLNKRIEQIAYIKEKLEDIKSPIELDKAEEDAKEEILRLFKRRNEIWGKLGAKAVEPKMNIIDLNPGDRLLLTSDGVHDNLAKVDLDELMKKGDEQNQDAVALSKEIVSASFQVSQTSRKENMRAKKDDITAVVVDMPVEAQGIQAEELEEVQQTAPEEEELIEFIKEPEATEPAFFEPVEEEKKPEKPATEEELKEIIENTKDERIRYLGGESFSISSEEFKKRVEQIKIILDRENFKHRVYISADKYDSNVDVNANIGLHIERDNWEAELNPLFNKVKFAEDMQEIIKRDKRMLLLSSDFSFAKTEFEKRIDRLIQILPADFKHRVFIGSGKYNSEVNEYADVILYIENSNWEQELRKLLGIEEERPKEEMKEEKPEEEKPPIFKVGDLVQWTSQGVDQFPQGKAIVKDLGAGSDDRRYYMVEGVNTGLSENELSLFIRAEAPIVKEEEPKPVEAEKLEQVADYSYLGGLFTGYLDKDKLPQGEGVFRDADGNVYRGEFEKGEKHGIGRMTYDNGESKFGKWEHGEYIGEKELGIREFFENRPGRLVPIEESPEEEEKIQTPPKFKADDLVQRTSGGVDQFKKSKKIIEYLGVGLDDKKYYRVEGVDARVPEDELSVFGRKKEVKKAPQAKFKIGDRVKWVFKSAGEHVSTVIEEIDEVKEEEGKFLYRLKNSYAFLPEEELEKQNILDKAGSFFKKFFVKKEKIRAEAPVVEEPKSKIEDDKGQEKLEELIEVRQEMMRMFEGKEKKPEQVKPRAEAPEVSFWQKAKQAVLNKETGKVIGEAVYKTVGSVLGFKFVTDLGLAVFKKGDIYSAIKGREEIEGIMGAVNEYIISQSSREMAEEAVVTTGETMTEHRARILREQIGQAKHISSEGKQKLLGKLDQILEQHRASVNEAGEARNRKLQNSIEAYLTKKVSEISIARDAFNTILTSTGMVALRGAMYAGGAVLERARKAIAEYQQKKAEGRDVSAIGYLAKDIFVNSALETASVGIWSKEKERTKGRKFADVVQAIGAVARGFGIYGLAIAEGQSVQDGIEKFVSAFEQKGLAGAVADNFVNNADKTIDVYTHPGKVVAGVKKALGIGEEHVAPVPAPEKPPPFRPTEEIFVKEERRLPAVEVHPPTAKPAVQPEVIAPRAEEIAVVHTIQENEGLLHAANDFQRDPKLFNEIIAGVKKGHPQWADLSDEKIIHRWRIEQAGKYGYQFTEKGEIYTKTLHPGAKVSLVFDKNDYPQLEIGEEHVTEHAPALRPRAVEAIETPIASADRPIVVSDLENGTRKISFLDSKGGVREIALAKHYEPRFENNKLTISVGAEGTRVQANPIMHEGNIPAVSIPVLDKGKLTEAIYKIIDNRLAPLT